MELFNLALNLVALVCVVLVLVYLLMRTVICHEVAGELKIAREIPKSLLPHLFPASPDRDEFTVCALLEPAVEMDGDFYGFFLIDRDRLCLHIDDVFGMVCRRRRLW